VVRRAIWVVVGAAQEGHDMVLLLTQRSCSRIRIPQQTPPPLPAYGNLTLPHQLAGRAPLLRRGVLWNRFGQPPYPDRVSRFMIGRDI